MEEKKITFRYDTLCITEGRYEFKRIYKRPWRVMLCGIFNMKLVVTLAILFFVFLYSCFRWASQCICIFACCISRYILVCDGLL